MLIGFFSLSRVYMCVCRKRNKNGLRVRFWFRIGSVGAVRDVTFLSRFFFMTDFLVARNARARSVVSIKCMHVSGTNMFRL
jgi:hypothetical protein